MKKKIAFVIESLHLGGAEKSLVTLLNNLDYEKFDIYLLTFQKGDFFDSELPNEVNRIEIKSDKITLLDRLRYWIRKKISSNNYHNAQLFWPIVTNKYSVLENFFDIAIAYNQGFSTYYVSKFINSSKKFSWLNIDYNKAGYNIDFDYPYYQKFNKIIAVSPECATGLKLELSKKNLDLPIDIIKDITDKDLLVKKSFYKTNYKYQNGKINIVSVGRLAHQKGFEIAIRACKILVEKGYDINWCIVGEGPLRDKLQDMIHDNNLSSNFHLLGADANPYPYMRLCDLYVQTSLYEGLGLTVIEASYLNKPIVSTNFPTIHGIIEDKYTGLVAEMNEISVAKNIELLINDSKLRQNFISRLDQKVDLDKQQSIEKVHNLFN